MEWLGRKKKTTETHEQEQLLQQILNDMMVAKREMEIALQNFNNAPNDELVDIYSYQFSAAQTKCNYLIRLAKESGLGLARSLEDRVLFPQKNCS